MAFNSSDPGRALEQLRTRDRELITRDDAIDDNHDPASCVIKVWLAERLEKLHN